MGIAEHGEKRFQNRLITSIKELGGEAIHLEPAGHAGFPDLLITLGNQYRLVELKHIKKVTNSKFSILFQYGQLAWIAARIINSAPVFIAIKEETTGSIWLIEVVDSEGPLELAKIPISEVLEFPKPKSFLEKKQVPFVNEDEAAYYLLKHMGMK